MTSLVEPTLAVFQGPALLAYNDAQFTEKDWQSIQDMQQSVKVEDPFKVGKFGIGFNSVYHITGKLNLFNTPPLSINYCYLGCIFPWVYFLVKPTTSVFIYCIL